MVFQSDRKFDVDLKKKTFMKAIASQNVVFYSPLWLSWAE